MPRNQFEERQQEQSCLDIMTVIGYDLLEEIQQSVALIRISEFAIFSAEANVFKTFM